MKIPEFLKAGFVSLSPWLLVLAFLSWAGGEINSRISAAEHAYPRSVVSYGLSNARTDDDVIATVEIWKRDAWGAQIGALRVLCESDRDYVDSLGGHDVGARVCRITK